MPYLTIVFSPVDMIGGTTDKNVAVSGHAVHSIVFPVKGEKLSGQISLINVTAKLGAEIMETSFFIFGDIACALQIGNKCIDKVFIIDGINGLDLSEMKIEALGAADDVDPDPKLFVAAERQSLLGNTRNGSLVVIRDL